MANIIFLHIFHILDCLADVIGLSFSQPILTFHDLGSFLIILVLHFRWAVAVDRLGLGGFEVDGIEY